MNFKSSNYFSIKKKYLEFLKKKEVAGKTIVDKVGKFNTFYLPLSDWIYSTYKKDNKTKIIGLSGGQGAGKSTITGILKLILKKKYGLELCIFSIDDFYKTKSERKKMSRKVHPLFLTRGVPGTHDVILVNKTFKNLKKKFFKPVLIPKFDKSTDDRVKKSQWIKIKKPPSIIIFEGWCIGAKHQKENLLKKPLNMIEKKFDFDILSWMENPKVKKLSDFEKKVTYFFNETKFSKLNKKDIWNSFGFNLDKNINYSPSFLTRTYISKTRRRITRNDNIPVKQDLPMMAKFAKKVGLST